MIGVCCAVAALFAQPAADTAYTWPLDLPRIVTGSFGEFRPGRFHAGIDLRTGGNGIPVKAARDGEVTRLRCSPTGYGKAIYVTFDNGYSAVHAHLDGYADRLAAYIRTEQHRRERYEVDLEVAPGTFPVRAGEVIGFSGDSGTQAPHLHWEWRDPQGRPVNPRLAGLDWPDAVAPRLNKLLIVPQDAGATVNGDFVPIALPLDRKEQGQYAPVHLEASGRVALAIDVVDEAGAYKLGPYRIRLMQGDAEVFRLQHDVLSYDHLGDGAVCWLPFAQDLGRFLACYRWPGNRSESYAHTRGDGVLDVAAEPLDLRLEVADAHENVSTVSLRITPGSHRPAAAPDTDGDAAGQVTYSWHGLYHTADLRFPGAEVTEPALEVTPRDGVTLSPLIRVGPGEFRAAFQIQDGREHRFTVRHPQLDAEPERFFGVRQDAHLELATEGFTMQAVPGTAYGVLQGSLGPLSDVPPADEITVYGLPTLLEPVNAPLRAPLRVAIALPENAPENAAIWRWSNGWSMLESRRSGGRLSADSSRLGAFVIAADNRAPRAKWQTPPENYQAKTKRPHVRVELTETGSGLAHYEVRCGGQWLLCAYDPKKRGLEWLRDEDLPAGEQTLSVLVRDRAGNETRGERRLIVP